MPSDPFADRQQALQQTLLAHSLDGLALNPGPDLRYLTGLSFHLMERPVIAIFPAQGSPIFILPELEREKLSTLPYSYQAFAYPEDRSRWPVAFEKAFQQGKFSEGKIGVIPRRIRLLEMGYLRDAAPQANFTNGQQVISALRIKKDGKEIQAMRESARLAQRALTAVQDRIQPGVTEKELAAALVSQLLTEGSDPDLPFFPIVSFGKHSANPHATPTGKALEKGHLVLIDWGATVKGYHSDITRVFAVGVTDQKLIDIAGVVQEANRVGRDVIKPGIRCSEVDHQTRQVIEKAGYGDQFLHRTGHGLGMEAHEEPYISADDDTVLEPGMTFTIEPGIYLPGTGGVRIEDDVLVTEDGSQSLTDMSRELTILQTN